MIEYIYIKTQSALGNKSYNAKQHANKQPYDDKILNPTQVTHNTDSICKNNSVYVPTLDRI